MKNNKIRNYFLLIMVLCGTMASAQERLVVSNATVQGKNCIWLKFYDEKVFYPEGVNIYRITDDEQRIKLNAQPFKKGFYQIPEEKLSLDSMLQEYKGIADNVKPQDVKGFLSLLLIIKTLEDNDYAKYVGVLYEDCDIVSGNRYAYEVYEIIGGKEKLIEKSTPIKVETFQPIESPDSLNIIATDSKVTIVWKPEAKAFWATNIYRKRADEDVFIQLNKSPVIISETPQKNGSKGYPEIFFIDDSVQNGISYTYKIEGIDYFARPTQATQEITVTPRDLTPPISPSNVRTEVGLLDITLTWQNNFKSKDMLGYNIYRKRGRNDEQLKINKELLPHTQEIYYDTLTEPGVYIYYVASVDSSGNEGFSYPSTKEILDIFPPKSPKGLEVAADTGRIILSWSENTEKDLLGYRIYRTVGNDRDGNYVLLNADPIKETEYIDSLPKNAKNFFFYKIAALDSAFNMSEYSQPRSSRMPDIIAPRAPFITNVFQNEKSMKIEWLSNAESDLMGYDIYRFQLSDSTNTLKRLNISILPSNAMLFTDNWAEGNTAYRYYLTAIDSSGNISEPSVSYDGMLIVEPDCKTEVRKLKGSTKKDGKISLTWKVDNKNDDTFQGSIVYKKTENTQAFKALTNLLNGEKYTDKFAGEDKEYKYQIRTYDKNGCIAKSEEISIIRK